MVSSKDLFRQRLCNRLSSTLLNPRDLEVVRLYLGLTKANMRVALGLSTLNAYRKATLMKSPLPAWSRFEILVDLMVMGILFEEFIKENGVWDYMCDIPDGVGVTQAMRDRFKEYTHEMRRDLVCGAESRVLARGALRGIAADEGRKVYCQPKHADNILTLPVRSGMGVSSPS